MRERIIHDATQSYEINESVPWFLTVNNENSGSFTTRVKLLENVAIDFICDAISVIALIDNPDNPGQGDLVPTSQIKINMRDSLSQEGWIFTAGGSLPQFTPIPISLFAGIKPTPLPTPRALYQNSQIEVLAEPESGVEICYFSMTFYGRRLDTMAPWERKMYCGDPRTSGAYWIYCGPNSVERRDGVNDPCARGPVSSNKLRIPNLPFDSYITSISGIITDPSNDCVPLGRAIVEFKLTDMNTRHDLMQNFVSTALLGGSNMYGHDLAPSPMLPCDQEQVALCCPRSMAIYGAWRIRSQSSIECQARAVYSPLDDSFTTMNLQILLHGMRVPSDEIAIGYPYYNRNDGSLRCPPGGEGIPPGIPSGPQPPYNQPMWPQQQSPQQQLPPPQNGQNLGYYNNGYGR